jgi:hypothetical protein
MCRRVDSPYHHTGWQGLPKDYEGTSAGATANEDEELSQTFCVQDFEPPPLDFWGGSRGLVDLALSPETVLGRPHRASKGLLREGIDGTLAKPEGCENVSYD